MPAAYFFYTRNDLYRYWLVIEVRSMKLSDRISEKLAKIDRISANCQGIMNIKGYSGFSLCICDLFSKIEY